MKERVNVFTSLQRLTNVQHNKGIDQTVSVHRLVPLLLTCNKTRLSHDKAKM